MSTKEFPPLKVGIVGTGYAARKRAEAIIADPRTQLLWVTGNTPERQQEFCQSYGVAGIDSWTRLVDLPELDLIFVCTINRDCGAIAKGGILAEKHVVVEYPLALDAKIAQEIIDLAKAKQKLLHVEHIEIIGGLHQAVKECLPQIGKVFFARYSTIRAQHPVEFNWKYHRGMFGFPLAAALSRIHRLTDLFGAVATVACQNRYWDKNSLASSDYFTACLCNAQLNFHNGVVAEVTYGKGDIFWHSHRLLEIYGEQGSIVFTGEKGVLTIGQKETAIPVSARRGLFAKDTDLVLDRLFNQQPLYMEPEASVQALKVANAALESCRLGQTIYLK